MTRSSPIRPHMCWGSPTQAVVSEILAQDGGRNSEEKHIRAIEEARREHERVREEAERVLLEQLKWEEAEQVRLQTLREQVRIRQEQKLKEERLVLQRLREKKIEVPPPPPPSAATAPAKQKDRKPLAAPEKRNVPAPGPGLLNGNSSVTQSLFQDAGKSLLAFPISGAGSQPAAASTTQANGLTSASAAATSPIAASAKPLDRYLVIHKNLKDLRKSMNVQANADKAFQDRMGEMRREIRKSVGQITTVSGPANRRKHERIKELLTEALRNELQSQLIDVANFTLEPRMPVNGAVHNGEQMPSLFIYLLNILAKIALSQFVNEAAVRREMADPIGVLLASLFSEPDFHWRGQSLIDIIMAKYRAACPVLFGFNGSEKTEQGRQRLGWRKGRGDWMPEQQHFDRMTGLGIGFAAISLRNFGKSKKVNPYPPRNYWTAMARILNTPRNEISSTQCVVLKSMIEGFEQKFLEAYGTAAVAALRMALVEFPSKASTKSAAVSSLEVLAVMMARDSGLHLK